VIASINTTSSPVMTIGIIKPSSMNPVVLIYRNGEDGAGLIK
jgi:hypothetical protein